MGTVRRRGSMLAGGLLLTVVACSGGAGESAPPPPEGEPQASGSPSATATASPSPSPSASPSPTEESLSRFEDEPEVQALRRWAVAVGRAVNDNDAALSGAVDTMTARGVSTSAGAIEEDLGLYYPGPLPLTPLRIRSGGPGSSGSPDSTVVRACVWTDGFALERRGRPPAGPEEISVVDIALVDDGQGEGGQAWRVDHFDIVDDARCQVPVTAVPW